jgi:hypothetical protein
MECTIFAQNRLLQRVAVFEVSMRYPSRDTFKQVLISLGSRVDLSAPVGDDQRQFVFCLSCMYAVHGSAEPGCAGFEDLGAALPRLNTWAGHRFEDVLKE